VGGKKLLPGISFGLALFFGIFLLSGNGAHMFMLYVIGLTGMGAFILLTGLTIPQKAWINKSFQTEKNFPTIIVKCLILFVGISMLISSIDYWRDVPSYFKKELITLSGKPTLIEEYTTTKGGGTDTYVTVKGKTFELLEPGPKYKYEKPEVLKEKVFTFYYLPHSEWIVDYKME
jgi:hypothetical protein